MFKNRIDAGIQLAEKLLRFKNENVVVLAIPRGGLPIGSIVAKTLNAPLDVALTKKIGHPDHKEYAIGAISLDDVILTNAFGVPQDYLDKEIVRIRKRLGQRYEQYYVNRCPQSLKDKTVIIVDDGVATGNTILATIELVAHQKPKKIIVAIPVAPSTVIRKFETISNVTETICLRTPYDFQAVGQFYKVFGQVSDQKAIQLLEETNTINL
ncbi:phosphoribosyltransferase [Ulvibacterium marinum]|uniref:Phosphoribosyltransferase n=1 Tax=Ulvibacterium marinum TaxID=2419782 RepID=A0A3B0C3D8_9FLAO|nr:phosphoribosyltransferase family protein [Ulvibacterium marinum]RKN80222.1 phosphoribosyltransferase [Ulvibacterium marinum]